MEENQRCASRVPLLCSEHRDFTGWGFFPILLLLSPCLFLANLLILQCSAPNAFSPKSDQTAPHALLLPSLFIPSAGSPGQETEAPGEKGDHKNQLKK